MNEVSKECINVTGVCNRDLSSSANSTWLFTRGRMITH